MSTRATAREMPFEDVDARTAAPSNRDDDDDLVDRLQRGDHTAFWHLVRRHQHAIFRLAMRLTRDESRAQDVVQDAFLQVFRNVRQFERQSKFATWLHRVTVNAALMRLRTERRRHETSIDDASPRYTDDGEIAEPVVDWSAAVDERVIDRELARMAAEAVDGLPESYRSVFVLREMEELSTEEVAEILELSASAVKTRLHRARLALRKALTRRMQRAGASQK
jgi:RNA polymerase sigma-70 factor (ECF subfamily)